MTDHAAIAAYKAAHAPERIYTKLYWDIANKIGIREALLIEVVERWCSRNQDKEKGFYYQEGEWWTAATYEEWSNNYPALGSSYSLQRIFLKLEKEGYILSGQFCRGSQLKFYRPNPEKLGVLILEGIKSIVAKSHHRVAKSHGTIANPHDVYKEEIINQLDQSRSLSPQAPLSAKLPAESPPPTPEERERESSLKAKENSQRNSETPRLRSGKKAKSLHKAKNPDSDTHAGGVAVAKIYEIEPGVVNQDFLEWRSRYYIEQGGKWAKAPVSNALSDIQKSESRALALWQDYQNSIARQSSTANQPLEFSPTQMTDRQHKDWAEEYQANREEFMAKPEFPVWWAYLEARPTFKEMIFRGINSNGTTAQQGQLARIQRKEAAAVPNRGGRGNSRGNPARSRGGDGQDSRPPTDERILRERAQCYLQWLSEPPQGG